MHSGAKDTGSLISRKMKRSNSKGKHESEKVNSRALDVEILMGNRDHPVPVGNLSWPGYKYPEVTDQPC